LTKGQKQGHHEEVPQTTTMPSHSTIRTERTGQTSAFTPDGKLVMNYGSPHVAWGFQVKELEEWLTTLEELMPTLDRHNCRSIEKLYFSLKTAHKYHEREHEQVVTNAPSETDLMSYLTSYAAAMACEAMGESK
jgi:hypothetical protein